MFLIMDLMDRELIDDNIYDFVIADSILPGKSGLDLLDYIPKIKSLKYQLSCLLLLNLQKKKQE